MTTKNGKVATKVAEAVIQQQPEPWQPRMYRLQINSLTPRDMKRAKATVLGGKDPWAWVSGDESDETDVRTLIMWCLKSRHIPGFTWDQAEDTPYSEFLPATDAEPPPPQGQASDSPGRSSEPSARSESSDGQPSAEITSSSASSSD